MLLNKPVEYERMSYTVEFLFLQQLSIDYDDVLIAKQKSHEFVMGGKNMIFNP